MQGCIAMGLGYALAEEVRFENGRLLDTNFDTYAIPRFSWLPKIETVLVPNSSLPPREAVSTRSSEWGTFYPRRFTMRPALKCYSSP
jgi:xanthine dehydrogenase molybdopterin-binding subunit B